MRQGRLIMRHQRCALLPAELAPHAAQMLTSAATHPPPSPPYEQVRPAPPVSLLPCTAPCPFFHNHCQTVITARYEQLRLSRRADVEVSKVYVRTPHMRPEWTFPGWASPGWGYQVSGVVQVRGRGLQERLQPLVRPSRLPSHRLCGQQPIPGAASQLRLLKQSSSAHTKVMSHHWHVSPLALLSIPNHSKQVCAPSQMLFLSIDCSSAHPADILT